MRVGFGVDVHGFDDEPPVVLCGIVVATDRGIDAVSDGDVAAHALIDALLGAAALGDLGQHFSADESAGADSMDLLTRTLTLVGEAGWAPANVDLTIIAEKVRVAPHRDAMRERLSGVLGLALDAVSVKATTTDGLGFLGADDGIASTAIATIRRA